MVASLLSKKMFKMKTSEDYTDDASIKKETASGIIIKFAILGIWAFKSQGKCMLSDGTCTQQET